MILVFSSSSCLCLQLIAGVNTEVINTTVGAADLVCVGFFMDLLSIVHVLCTWTVGGGSQVFTLTFTPTVNQCPVNLICLFLKRKSEYMENRGRTLLNM